MQRSSILQAEVVRSHDALVAINPTILQNIGESPKKYPASRRACLLPKKKFNGQSNATLVRGRAESRRGSNEPHALEVWQPGKTGKLAG